MDRRTRKKWTMPEWMEPYRELFCNTGGNPIEDLMNDHDCNIFNNSVRVILIGAVDGQIGLLTRLKDRGMLSEPPAPSRRGKR